MISIPPQARIFANLIPITTDSDIDDQISACKKTGLDPFSGDSFVFKNIETTQIGILAYDGHGFEWCIKRFSEGTLAWWHSENKVVQITPHELQIMLWGGNPKELKLPPMWRPIDSMANNN